VLARVNSRISAGNLAPDFSAAASTAGCPVHRSVDGLGAQFFFMRTIMPEGVGHPPSNPPGKLFTILASSTWLKRNWLQSNLQNCAMFL
jgi:hypothetical protein